MVEIPPIITLYMSRVISTSGFMETIPPTTSPANESFAKSKNNPASFSRLTHILSHKEQDSECFSLQWEVEDTAALHRWHTQQGMHLNEEMMKIFKDKVVGFPTLMEVIK